MEYHSAIVMNETNSMSWYGSNILGVFPSRITENSTKKCILYIMQPSQEKKLHPTQAHISFFLLKLIIVCDTELCNVGGIRVPCCMSGGQRYGVEVSVMTSIHPFLPFMGSKEQTQVSNLAWQMPLLTETTCCASIFTAFEGSKRTMKLVTSPNQGT